MATIICKVCQVTFEGRPNRLYCSVSCRKAAEMEERERKGREMVAAWFGMSPAEFESLSTMFQDVPRPDELWPDLLTAEELWPELFTGNFKNA